MAMRPKTKLKELPMTHNVLRYIHNQFIEHFDDLKETFKVCISDVQHKVKLLTYLVENRLHLGKSQLWQMAGQ